MCDPDNFTWERRSSASVSFSNFFRNWKKNWEKMSGHASINVASGKWTLYAIRDCLCAKADGTKDRQRCSGSGVGGSSCTFSYQPSYSRAAWPALLRQTHGTCCCRVYGVFTSDVTATPEYGGWTHPSRRNDIPLFIADTYVSTVVEKREMERTKPREYEGENNRDSLSQMTCWIMTLIIADRAILGCESHAMESRKRISVIYIEWWRSWNN